MSKMLGRSKSEDSVCNSSHDSTPVHDQVRVSYAQSCAQPTVGYRQHGADAPAVGASLPQAPPHTHVGVGAHFFHTTTGAANSALNCI